VPPGVAPADIRDSEALSLAGGAYDVVLSEARLPMAGDAVALPARSGPVGLWLVEGQVSLGGQVLAPGGVAVLRPGAAATLTSAGGGARVLAQRYRIPHRPRRGPRPRPHRQPGRGRGLHPPCPGRGRGRAVVNHAGHNAQTTHPHLIGPAMLDFLSRHDGPPGR
jgi:hypothetical protein